MIGYSKYNHDLVRLIPYHYNTTSLPITLFRKPWFSYGLTNEWLVESFSELLYWHSATVDVLGVLFAFG